MEEKKYTHRDSGGMPWRLEGGALISALADKVMKEFDEEMNQKKSLESMKGEEK